MRTRVPETHVWPDAIKAAKAVPLTALVKSASSNIKIGALGIVIDIIRSSSESCMYLPAKLGCVRCEIGSCNATNSPSCWGTGLHIRVRSSGSTFAPNIPLYQLSSVKGFGQSISQLDFPDLEGCSILLEGLEIYKH